jgi:DNA-binding GntR family transcriptional regulator
METSASTGPVGLSEIDRSQPAKMQAYEYVRGEILRDSLNEPHFMNEETVGRVLGLSRTPVREAFLMLEAEGLLQLVPRKGALIVPITERQMRDVMEARSVVESWSATRVLVDDEARARVLRRLVALHEELLALGDDDLTALIECDRRFHRELIETAGNQVMLDLYERMRDLQLRMGVQAVLDDPDRVEAVRREHQRIIDAIADGGEAGVLAAISDHLDATAQSVRRRMGAA